MKYQEKNYWNKRYSSGRTSGGGSEGQEGLWKVEKVIKTARKYKAHSILDFGCGDGQIAYQLLSKLTRVEYLGLDISQYIIEKNLERAKGLKKVNFLHQDLSSSFEVEKHDMSICLDVLFHLSSQNKHNKVIANFFDSFKKVGILSCWNDSILKKYNGSFAEHTFYRKLIIPKRFSFERIVIPMEPCKDLYIITRK